MIEQITSFIPLDIMPEIILAVFAFLGAYVGTKSIKRRLVDNYIEARVIKASEANDRTLYKARNIISELEQTYKENRPLTEDDLQDIIDQCKELSQLSEDGGKEVSTVSYLLYHTVEDLKPKEPLKNSWFLA
ncbi:MAG: hypothetical protein Q8L60_16405 [Gammaproteobacteria bacterium]|nr:hypothetical protein [Gammaproteobacteria bacterium]MDP2349524.1 hypothetical protein [Gammaproteobacteria bacterium]